MENKSEMEFVIKQLERAEKEGLSPTPCKRWLHRPRHRQVVRADTPQGSTRIVHCSACDLLWQEDL